MHRVLTAIQRGFKEWIGWKRLGSPRAFSSSLPSAPVRTLKGVDTGVVLIALTEKSPHQIALAALCVIGAFCTLTFYDFRAADDRQGLRALPHRRPVGLHQLHYRPQHRRDRLHGRRDPLPHQGLSAIDVAKICFISGLTFWLGNLFVLGLGMTWHPWAASAMDLLPP